MTKIQPRKFWKALRFTMEGSIQEIEVVSYTE